MFFFFFSSRRRHTRFKCDWSSDVCSSDLMLRGTAFLVADPRNPHDAVIVDLENAPRNAAGLVEFSTPFLILKPVDMLRSNHKIFYAVNNRGNNLEGLLTATTAGQVSGTDAGY